VNYPATPSGGDGTSSHPQLKKGNINSMPNRGKPLYLQMALKDSEAERDALEEKKKKLEEIRAFHKPLEKRDMMDHALNY